MKTLINNFVEKITVKKAIIATVVFAIMLWLIDYSPIGVAGLLKITDGVSILDFETRYSADFGYNWLASMGEAGRNFHLTRIMPLDIFYPPCFMLCMLSWLGLVLQKNTKNGSFMRYTMIFPMIYLALDWTENVGITAMLLNFPTRLDGICVATGMVTSIKQTIVLITIVLFFIQFIVLLGKKIVGVVHAKTKR